MRGRAVRAAVGPAEWARRRPAGRPAWAGGRARTCPRLYQCIYNCRSTGGGRQHAPTRGRPPPPAPTPATIGRLITAAFWASVRREEGRTPTISLAYLPREEAGTALFVERPLPLDPATLTKLAPAVERPGIHLGVWEHEGDLCVWGATRSIPPLCFVVEVIEPGP